MKLEAKADCCEEASPLSSEFYIPCNRPATAVLIHAHTGEGPYRMCDACAGQNRRRGFIDHII
jgi:hypothetical protein